MSGWSLALGIAAVAFLGSGGFALASGVVPPPSPPRVLEDARDACSRAQVGERCRVRIDERSQSGMCVVFSAGALVCAVDAPP